MAKKSTSSNKKRLVKVEAVGHHYLYASSSLGKNNRDY